MAVLVGKKAPDFRTKAVVDGQLVDDFALSHFKGKNVVLFFYPLDFTFVCPTELHAFQEKINEFETTIGAIFAGVCRHVIFYGPGCTGKSTLLNSIIRFWQETDEILKEFFFSKRFDFAIVPPNKTIVLFDVELLHLKPLPPTASAFLESRHRLALPHCSHFEFLVTPAVLDPFLTEKLIIELPFFIVRCVRAFARTNQ